MDDYEKFVARRAEKYGLSVEMTERVGRAFWATGDPLTKVITEGLAKEGKGHSLADFLDYASRHDLSQWLKEPSTTDEKTELE